MEENSNKYIHTFAALADLGQEVAHTNNFQEMIRTSLHLLVGSLAIMRGGVARFDRFGHELNFLAMRGLGEDFPLSLNVTRDDEKEWLSNGLEPFDLEDCLNCLTPFLLRYKPIFEAKKIELVVPLIVRDELVGLILLGEKANGASFTSADKEIVCAMARHIGVGIQQRNLMSELERRADENRRLYDGLRLTYKDTVKAFAAAIDCKDKYTEGHSVRVGKYSEIIAAELGWDEERVEGVAVAAYLHDVGKLVVDRNIINSPIRITASENAQLSKHPAVGYEILMPIHHPYAEVPLAAKYHHERLDGRGYPDGLIDREIPYIAKIVNLADSFDAMTTDRPYKRRRVAEEVIEDLWRSSGNQFAPEIVTAFCRAMLKEMTGESKTRRFRRLLGKGYMEAATIVPQLKNVLNGISPTSSLTLVSMD
jgi:HD-GYP domain-containing protein (c-di-GMP phosphodiesterase class II)